VRSRGAEHAYLAVEFAASYFYGCHRRVNGLFGNILFAVYLSTVHARRVTGVSQADPPP